MDELRLQVVDPEVAGGSVLAQLDHCGTPGGRRQLRRWLARPLHDIEGIRQRLDAVTELVGPLLATMDDAEAHLTQIGDFERAVVSLAVTSTKE
jgi:DNA mismatch repair ATPase MutS